MVLKRTRKAARNHYVLLVNKQAAAYSEKAVSRLITAIRRNGGAYTVYEPETAIDLLRQSEVACGLRRASTGLPRPFPKAGKVTSLIACGGDGTFNLAARVAWRTDLPIGLYPLGRLNNIARSLYDTVDPEKALPHILSPKTQEIDVGLAGNLPFYGSIGLGFIERLAEHLEQKAPPRFGIGWSKLGALAAAEARPEKTVLRVDSFRFEVHPLMINVNLLKYCAGLPLSPSSMPGDGYAEIIFDVGDDLGHFSTYTRLIHKKKYLYGDTFRLYRGRSIMIQPVKGRMARLDGEPVEIPAEILEIKIEEKKLQVLY